jgi:hypothetical protein
MSSASSTIDRQRGSWTDALTTGMMGSYRTWVSSQVSVPGPEKELRWVRKCEPTARLTVTSGVSASSDALADI